VPLGLVHVQLPPPQTLGLPAVRGGQQVPGRGRNTPRNTRSTSDEIPLIRSNTC
jgi:hypothetical protein